MNHAQQFGNLGRDFEVQTHARKSNGEAFIVAKNSLAVPKKTTTRDSNGDRVVKEHTDWIPIQIFGKAAENAAKYFKKGDRFLCDGEIRTSSYVDDNGQTKSSWCLEVKRFYFVMPAPKTQDGTQAQNVAQSPTNAETNANAPQNLPEMPPEFENANVVTDEIIENAEETTAVVENENIF